MKTEILGIPFENQKKRLVLASIEEGLREKRPVTVFTPNPLMVQTAQKDPQFLSILQSATLNLPDGVGILLGARLLGNPIKERIAGIDLAESLLPLIERKELRLFLLGGKPGVADDAAKALWLRYPKLNICGVCHGFFEEEDGATLAAHIAAKRPHVLFVCLGSPKQERFIAHHLERTGAILAIGLGGSLDVWAGKVHRAPRFLQKMGLEWLWRMTLEPRRLRGLPHIVAFLATCYRQRQGKTVKSHNSRNKNC